jgi:hypothetical protein
MAAWRRLLFGFLGPYSGAGLMIWMVLSQTATQWSVAAAGALLLLKIGDPGKPGSPSE